MSNTLYAIYRTSEQADRAFVELLQRGASLLDLVVITRQTYNYPVLGVEDGAQGLGDHDRLEHVVLKPTPTVPVRTDDEANPNRCDPFGVTPGGTRLLHNLNHPGDLAGCLVELGFGEESATPIEAQVLEGGALFVLRVPAGPVDEAQAAETFERHGGSIVAPIRSNLYLG